MQKQKNYKNAGTQILIPDNSVEPFNTMSSGNTGLSSSSNLEGYETILEKIAINRVDSKNHNLPEPSREKVLQFIEELSKITEIKKKSNLRRIIGK